MLFDSRFGAAPKLESLSRASLRESEPAGFGENRRFESCRRAGILISGLFERIGIAGFAATAALELPPGWNPYLGSL